VTISRVSLFVMLLARRVLFVALVVALATYVLNCAGMTTPEQAMQCCNSMPCSSQGHHGQDCCKTMPSMHAPFVQPSTAHAGFSFHVLVVLPASSESIDLAPSARSVTSDWHAPPLVHSPSPLPLRI
jgi:hypothetical protein